MTARSPSVGLELEEPRLVCEHDCLDAIAEVELLEDVRDVCLDGRVADVELLRDLCVREAAGNRAKDLLLTWGSARRILLEARGRGRRVNCLITRFVIVGERSASPAATVRIAAISCSGGSSFRTKPLAPALSAS